MWRRWRAYLIGVGLGCLIVYITLIRGRDRDFDFWFPGPRVLTELAEGIDLEDDQTRCFMNCYQIFESDLEFLWENGNVDFSKSKVRGNPQIYFVNTELDSKGTFEIKFESTPELVRIVDVRTTNKQLNCDCE